MNRPDSGYASMSLDVQGVVAYAQHHRDADLLMATFPALTTEQAFAIADGMATLIQEGRTLRYEPNQVH